MSRVGAGLVFALAVASIAAQTPSADAVFAGGCFWGMEEAFERVPGVVAVHSGYTGGHVKNPGYEDVGSGRTGHVEAVRVRYDASKVSYARLLDVYWHSVDPTDRDGQFCDRGAEYRPLIFVRDAAERQAATESKQALQASARFKVPIAVEIVDAAPFYLAEAEHQDFYRKESARYHQFEVGCGRPQRLAAIWGPPKK